MVADAIVVLMIGLIGNNTQISSSYLEYTIGAASRRRVVVYLTLPALPAMSLLFLLLVERALHYDNRRQVMCSSLNKHFYNSQKCGR